MAAEITTGLIGIWESFGYNAQTMLLGIGIFLAGYGFGRISSRGGK